MNRLSDTDLRHNGFTLVELSIVLVIIALLVAGVLAGQGLLKAAELRAVLAEVDTFNRASYAFRAKYNCLPGDCPNATSFFGTSATCPNGDGTVGPGTCNGNGDGRFNGYDPGRVYETVRFWQHLGMAGLVEGVYSGDFSVTMFYSSGPLTNVPRSRVGDAVWWPNDQNFYDVSPYNKLILGGITGQAWAPVLNAGDVFALDVKADDGLPTKGSMLAINGYDAAAGGFYATGCVAGSVYEISETRRRCLIMFHMK